MLHALPAPGRLLWPIALAALDHALALDRTYPAWRDKAISLRALGRKAKAQEAERGAKKLGG